MTLNEIRAALNAATPGPWFLGSSASGYWVECGEKGEDGERNQWIAHVDSDIKHERANATFIANAPTAVAALLAEVYAYRELVDDVIQVMTEDGDFEHALSLLQDAAEANPAEPELA